MEMLESEYLRGLRALAAGSLATIPSSAEHLENALTAWRFKGVQLFDPIEPLRAAERVTEKTARVIHANRIVVLLAIYRKGHGRYPDTLTAAGIDAELASDFVYEANRAGKYYALFDFGPDGRNNSSTLRALTEGVREPFQGDDRWYAPAHDD